MTSNSSKTAKKIIVDADSCPVKDTILKVAEELSIPVMMIASIAHQISSQSEHVQVITVDNYPQAVDIAVTNLTARGDIVVTGDYGLASLILAKGATPVSPRGSIYCSDNIDTLLFRRHLEAQIRRGGGRTKGPRAMTFEDRQRFESVLRDLALGKR